MRLDADGCIGDENCGVLVNDVEEIEEESNNVIVYPNPVMKGHSLHFDNVIQDELAYTICDIYGKIYLQGALLPSTKVINIDISSGIYFLSVPELLFTRKIVVVDP